VRPAVCALANDLPGHQKAGVIFISVKDNGAPANLEITDELLCNLADIRSDGNILPFPSMTVEARQLTGQNVVVTVLPADNPPVKYKG